MKLEINIQYPRRCPFCPKILNSVEQEDKHFRKIHIKAIRKGEQIFRK